MDFRRTEVFVAIRVRNVTNALLGRTPKIMNDANDFIPA